jgi:hypothetical protein
VERQFVMRRIEQATRGSEFAKSGDCVVSRRFPHDLFTKSSGGATVPIAKARTRVTAPEFSFWDTETALD